MSTQSSVSLEVSDVQNPRAGSRFRLLRSILPRGSPRPISPLPNSTPPVGTLSTSSAPAQQRTLDWHIDDDGNDLFQTPNPQPLSSSLRRVASRASAQSIAVPRLGILELTLADVCKYIDIYPSLQSAHIISTECYAQSAGAVTHRFVVLELQRSGRQNAWLRLDRRRGEGVSIAKFLGLSGITAANDRAQFAATKASLITNSVQENRQEFQSFPSLKGLSTLLRIITEEILQYRIWPENCWFFCSLIQEILGTAENSSFVLGSPQYRELAPHVRLRIIRRLLNAPSAEDTLIGLRTVLEAELVGDTDPRSTPSAARPPASSPAQPKGASSGSGDLEARGAPALDAINSSALPSSYRSSIPPTTLSSHEASSGGPAVPSVPFYVRWNGFAPESLRLLEHMASNIQAGGELGHLAAHSRHCVDVHNTLTSTECPTEEQGNYLVRQLEDLRRIIPEKQFDRWPDETFAVRSECVRLHRALLNGKAVHEQGALASALNNLGWCVSRREGPAEACPLVEEATLISRAVVTHEPTNPSTRTNFGRWLRNYSIYLRRAGRFLEAYKASAEAVTLFRELYILQPTQSRLLLCMTLDVHCTNPGSVQQFQEAVDVGAELVKLGRVLYEFDPLKYREQLAGYLSTFAEALNSCERGREAREVMGEAEVLSKPAKLHAPVDTNLLAPNPWQ